MSRYGHKTKEYTTEERQRVAAELISISKEGKIPHGGFKKISCEMGVSGYFVSNVWRRLRDCSTGVLDVSSGSQYRSKLRYALTEIASALEELPLTKRRTLRDAAANLGVSTTTIKKMIQSSVARVHSSAVRPNLTEENKYARYLFVEEHIEALYHIRLVGVGRTNTEAIGVGFEQVVGL